MSSTSGGQRDNYLEHQFSTVTKGYLTIWFLDTAPGASTLYSHLLVSNTTVAHGQPGYQFHVGVDDWNPNTYAVFGPGLSASTPTSVARTLGWHRFEIKIGPTAGQILIDGKVVHSFAGNYGFNKVALTLTGPVGRPDAAFSFDDYRFDGPIQNYSDKFDPNPFWTVRQQFGRISYESTGRSGPFGVRFTSVSGGQRENHLEHRFPAVTKGDVSVWFYDSAPNAETLYSHLRLSNSNVASGKPGYQFSVGVDDWNPTTYGVFGPGLASSTPTSIPRTLGWHRFEIKINSTGGQVLIDGKVVHSFTGDYAFNKVAITLTGPSWRPNASYLFDDFNFTAR